jgi:hypothetical protein
MCSERNSTLDNHQRPAFTGWNRCWSFAGTRANILGSATAFARYEPLPLRPRLRNSQMRSQRPARNVTATKGRWGCRSRHQLTRIDIKKLSLQDLYPRARQGNGTPTEDDGGAVQPCRSRSRHEPGKIIAAGPLPPTPRPARNVTAIKDDRGR